MSELVIGDHNYQQFLGNGQWVDYNGHRRYLSAKIQPGRPKLRGAMTLEQAGISLIPQSEWGDRIKDQESLQSSLKHLLKRHGATPSDQDGVGQCWIFGTCSAAETTILRQGGILRRPSPQSLAYQIYGGSGWGNGGGWPAESVQALMDNGAARASIWPESTSGQSSRYNTAQAQADCANHKLVKMIELGDQNMFAELITCLLLNIAVGCSWDWWNHYTEACYAGLSGSEVCTGIRNSWGEWGDGDGFGLLAGSKKTPGEAFAFLEMTQSTQVPT